jgi:hypothetical protein
MRWIGQSSMTLLSSYDFETIKFVEQISEKDIERNPQDLLQVVKLLCLGRLVECDASGLQRAPNPLAWLRIHLVPRKVHARCPVLIAVSSNRSRKLAQFRRRTMRLMKGLCYPPDGTDRALFSPPS